MSARPWLLVAATLAGCGAKLPIIQNAASSVSPYASAYASRFVPSYHATRGKKLHADRQTPDLLYVSNTSPNEQAVALFSYRSLKPKGALSGTWNLPTSVCHDAAQNVYVTNEDRHQILEYPPGKTQAIRILADPNGYPLSCAVDPTTGNLAVTDFYSGTAGGDVLLYRKGRGIPKVYASPNLQYYWFAGYDDRGNLFIDGEPAALDQVIVAEMPAGGKAFTDLSLNAAIGYPGAIAWDGTYLAIGDQDTNDVYRFAINGSTGTIMGTVPLEGAIDVFQFWISRRAGGNYQLAGADHGHAIYGTCTDSATDYWKYPQGGDPVVSIAGPECASGVTVTTRGK